MILDGVYCRKMRNSGDVLGISAECYSPLSRGLIAVLMIPMHLFFRQLSISNCTVW